MYHTVEIDSLSSDEFKIEEVGYNKGGKASIASSGFNMANSAIGGKKFVEIVRYCYFNHIM